MLTKTQVDTLRAQGRTIYSPGSGEGAEVSEEKLGALNLLRGCWRNEPNLPGRGWNLIALPFATEPGSPINYRLLLNQYNEELVFSVIDGPVPNRGIHNSPIGDSVDQDQFLFALDYQQSIKQIASADSPVSGKAGKPGDAIHHEPGLWLNILNEQTDAMDIARLATIPHGDSVLAVGQSQVHAGAPNIPDVNALPIGATQDLSSNYLAPYQHFHLNKFQNLFDPTLPNDLLRQANNGVNILRTTVLHVDTDIPTGGIVNIPFVVKQANATSMQSTFWIQELAETDNAGKPKLRLQYSQTVMLEFFLRFDGKPGLIRWPHISINTMEKVS